MDTKYIKKKCPENAQQKFCWDPCLCSCVFLLLHPLPSWSHFTHQDNSVKPGSSSHSVPDCPFTNSSSAIWMFWLHKPLFDSACQSVCLPGSEISAHLRALRAPPRSQPGWDQCVRNKLSKHGSSRLWTDNSALSHAGSFQRTLVENHDQSIQALINWTQTLSQEASQLTS